MATATVRFDFKVTIHMFVIQLPDGRLKCWTVPFGLLVYGDTHADLETQVKKAMADITTALNLLPDGLARFHAYLSHHNAEYVVDREGVVVAWSEPTEVLATTGAIPAEAVRSKVVAYA